MLFKPQTDAYPYTSICHFARKIQKSANSAKSARPYYKCIYFDKIAINNYISIYYQIKPFLDGIGSCLFHGQKCTSTYTESGRNLMKE